MDLKASFATRPAALLAAVLIACSPARPPAPVSPAPAPAGATTAPAPAQARALTIETSEAFTRALARGTRTQTGQPGPRYWQQWAEYKLEAELNPISKRISALGTATYHNRSPDTLRTVYVHLLHNIFAPGAKHNTNVPWAVEGVQLVKVIAQGKALSGLGGGGPGYEVTGTVMRIDLPNPIPPGGQAEFEFGWRLRVPPNGAPRGGQDGEVWFISYWYPQFAVYDDLNGWHTDPYLGNAEFYMGYANYDVALTVPAGWLVQATGTLRNPDEVLSERVRARLDSARRTAAIVQVVADTERVAGRSTTQGAGGKLTWRFRAENVRDVSWATSARYVWDATAAAVGDVVMGADTAGAASAAAVQGAAGAVGDTAVRAAGAAVGDGRPDTAMIHAFYRPEQRRSAWDQAARYGQHSIEFFSRHLWPYPYPHMTIVDGPTSCGGMEFPMMTCIGGEWDSTGLYEVVTHEIGHMWFPMQVGSDEKRYAWMDEGLTQFNQSAAIADIFPSMDDETENRQGYLTFAERGGEVELMRHGDRYPNYPSYGIASYYKPASVLAALRGVLGRDTFYRALREYGQRWRNKHPSPYDLFNTFENVSGRDLDWFWRTWFYETWKLDQAIDTVTRVGDSLEVVIENRGRAPMPVPLTITRANGEVDRITVPVDVWLTDTKRTTVRVAREPAPKTIEIDAARTFPDIERGNQIWPR